MTAVDDFLDAINGTTIPYVEVTDDAQNPYCDSCSEPIRPNSPVQLYGVNKLLTGHTIPSGFRSIRLHCKDCRLRRLYLPAAGYSEYLVDATVDTEWTLHDSEIVAVSPSSDGIDYDPKAIIEGVFGTSYEAIMQGVGYEAQGPLDALDILVVTDIDPREVVHEDGTVTVTDEHQEQFADAASDIFAKHERGDGPPQPSASAKLAGFLNTDPPEE